MEPFRFHYELSDEQKKIREKRIQELLSDELILRFLAKHKLDASFVDENSGLLKKWRQSYQICENCHSLNDCKQIFKGQRSMIDTDGKGHLMERLEDCRFLLRSKDKYGFLSNYRIRHEDVGCSDIDLFEIDLASQPANYLMPYSMVNQSLSDNKNGVFLYGQPGVGKTYLLWGAANYFAKNGKSVCFVKAPQLASEMKDAKAERDYKSRIINRLKTCDVLFVDDIGAEDITKQWRNDILLVILDYRMAHHLKTYFSSNYTLDELKDQYVVAFEENGKVAALRLIERIRALADPIDLKGLSRR